MEPQTRNITTDELEQLREGLSMLDVYRARKSPDTANRGLLAYHEAAKRLGLVEANASIETFLGRIRAEDFNSIMAPAVAGDTVPNDPAPEADSPSPSNGGEIEPTFSDGMATGQ